MEIFDPIFNLHKIKFNVLDSWNLIDAKTDRVNVYINLDNVFKLLINPRTNNFISASASMNEYEDYIRYTSRCLISNIINLGQHYRLWLVKKSIESRIILYWNFPVSEEYNNSKYVPYYRSAYNEKHSLLGIESSHIVKVMNDAVEFCKGCIQYINEVYLINAGKVESSLVPLILDREIYSKDGINTKNFIVSNSVYEYPYVNYGFKILAPSIKKKQPYLITKNNVIEILKGRAGSSSLLSVNTNFLEFIIALLGDHDRSIPTISGVGIVTILKMILTAIDDNQITNDTKDIEMLSGIINDNYKEIFERNYHCTNYEYQLNDIEPLDIHKITSMLIDNYDEVTLNEMNEKYFKKCPIDIIRPKSEQVLYDKNPYSSSIFSRH